MITHINLQLQKTLAGRLRSRLKALCPKLSTSIEGLKVAEAPLGNHQSGMALLFYIKKEDALSWGDYLCEVAWVCSHLYPHSTVYIISGLEVDIPSREYEIPILETLNSGECKRKDLLPLT